MKKNSSSSNIIQSETIAKKIFFIRGHKVMLDKDLAYLYGVSTGNLNLAVKRNTDRFPSDFMIKLTKEEFQNLILQNETSRWGGVRKLPYVFTEQGIAMLSSVLNSKHAIHVNIAIMRIFTKLRHIYITDKRIQTIESILKKHDMEIKNILDYMSIAEKPKSKIGFK